MGIGEAGPFDRIKSWIKQDVAIDLGTANTLVFLEGRGIVLSEPTVLALDELGRPFALGEKAKGFLGKTPPNIIVKSFGKKKVIGIPTNSAIKSNLKKIFLV